MPGSIQVSVLDFKELPSSSKSVKISLGKVEYDAGEKGTFSFPLTNLRDKLIIRIQDSEGNQVSHSGFPTMTILEKGVWDDLFSIEGGGVIHMKLEFTLSDEDRNRIRSMRESAVKKKQEEILGSRLRNAENAKSLALSLHRQEVSDVLRATSSHDFQRRSFNNDASLKASESFDGVKEESFQRQSFTNAIDKREETLVSHTTEEIEQNPNNSGNLVNKLYMQNLEIKFPGDVKKTNEESTSDKNNELLLQQAEVPKKLLEDTKTRDLLKNNSAAKTVPSDNLVEKLGQQNVEDKNPRFLKKMSKGRKFPPFSKETEVNVIKTNEIQLQKTDSPKSDVGSSRLTTAKLAGEMDKRASLEKVPQNIKKMISVFESSLSKDRVPMKPSSTKSNRYGTSRLLQDNMVKDCYEKPESNLKNSEMSSSTRLRNSFSTGDLRKTPSGVITKDNQVEYDDGIVESAEINMQSKGNGPNATEKMPKENIDEKCHQEKDEEIESSESPRIGASNGSFGQAMKIALVIGFGVVVLLLRQRETGKGKKENTRALRNRVSMNKRGSIEEQRRRIGVSRLS